MKPQDRLKPIEELPPERRIETGVMRIVGKQLAKERERKYGQGNQQSYSHQSGTRR
jgi:hypothetical protein